MPEKFDAPELDDTRPSQPRLEVSADSGPPYLWRARWALVFVTGLLAATIAVIVLQPAPQGTALLVRVPAPVMVPVDRPVVIREPAPVAPIAPDPVPDLPGCPTVAESGDRIGAPVSADELTYQAAALSVVAAATVPRIAILTQDYRALVSDDGGRSFGRAFASHSVIEQLAISREGVLYALEGAALGVRDLAGRETWRTVEFASSPDCEDCRDRIAVVGERLVWIHNDALATSGDRGRSWRRVSTADQAWPSISARYRSELFAWNGALYHTSYANDGCGVSSTYVHRLDQGGAIAHTIFHDYYDNGDEPVLEVTNDVDVDVESTWSWRERCWGKLDGEDRVVRCRKRSSAVRRAMLTAQTLMPVEGARTLAVYGGDLIELCRGGAREIYRAFPFTQIDAVDSAGRPLVVRGRALLRWSSSGWSRLYRVPEPPPV